jgi:hypothetical protein
MHEHCHVEISSDAEKLGQTGRRKSKTDYNVQRCLFTWTTAQWTTSRSNPRIQWDFNVTFDDDPQLEASAHTIWLQTYLNLQLTELLRRKRNNIAELLR